MPQKVVLKKVRNWKKNKKEKQISWLPCPPHHVVKANAIRVLQKIPALNLNYLDTWAT